MKSALPVIALAACVLAIALRPPAAWAAVPQAEGMFLHAAGCGTGFTAEDAARAIEREESGAYGAGRLLDGPLRVRTAIHIVRTSAGLGGLGEAGLAYALAQANADFAPLSIEFVVTDPVDYIDSDAFFYDIDTVAEINQLRSTNAVPHAMNIYFTENMSSENGNYCAVSSFSWNAYQGIVITNGCAPSIQNPTTLSHEIGHYFDLYHTHETAFGSECVDGSNCAVAGDRLCDTPADPNLQQCGASGHQYCVDTACQYTGTFLDPCHGAPYAPPVENFMSYSRPVCRTEFSPMQTAKAIATLTNIRPDHILETTGVVAEGEDARVPHALLGAPSPNPTRGTIAWGITLPAEATVSVRLHDASGRCVQTLLERTLGAGAHEFSWRFDGRLASGIYFLRLRAGRETASRAVVIAR